MKHYIVKKNDTLQRLASKELGSPSRWNEIAELNQLQNPDRIFEGQTLIIPEVRPSSLVKTQREPLQKYHVRYGDTLWKISEKFLGDPYRWGEIARLNRLEDPSCLYLSQVLVLPDDVKLSAESAAKYEQIPIRPQSETIRCSQKPATIIPGISHTYVFSDTNNKSSKENKPPEKKSVPPFLSDPHFENKLNWIGEGILDKNRFCFEKDKIKTLSKPEERSYYEEFLKNLSEMYNLSLEMVQTGLDTFDRWRELLYLDAAVEALESASKIRNAFPKGATYLQGIGFLFTAYDVIYSATESSNTMSFVPLRKEMTRQVFAWELAGAGAAYGTYAGTLVGIEMGPGAIVTGALGSLIGGYVGYYIGDLVGGFLYVDE